LFSLILIIPVSAFDKATYTNGMFGNSFFSINLGSGWTQNTNMLIGDTVSASYARNNMADFVSINANYAQSTDPLFPTSASSAQELMQNKRNTLEFTGAYNSFSEDSFTTNGGYKVHVLRYTQNADPSPQHYHFFIDATSSQYSGGQGNWFAIDIDFTSTTFPPVMTGISFEEAKAIIQSIDIDNNNLNSNSEDPIHVNSDQDQDSENSTSVFLDGLTLFFEPNASNTDLNRIVYDGPFQYGVPTNAKFVIDQSFLNHNFSSPIKHRIELSNPSDSISFDLGIEYDFIGLEEWANRQKNSWLFSEIGEMKFGQKFTNEAGFPGIVMLREQNSIEEIIIGINLTTEEWQQAAVLDETESSNPMLLCTVRLATQDQTSRNTVMAIAQSIDYKISPTFEASTFTEKLGVYSLPEPILDREFTSAELTFKISNESLVEVEQSFSQQGESTFGKFDVFPAKTKDNSIQLEIKTEKEFQDLQQWGQIKRNAWDQSDDSEITLAQSIITHFGYPSISIAREKNDSNGEKLMEFEIVVDLTSAEWRENFSDGWIKAIVSGELNMSESSELAWVHEFASSLYLNTEESKPPSFTQNVPENPTTLSRYQNSFQDGPILFFRSDDQLIDISKAFFDRSSSALAKYTFFSENRQFMKLAIYREDDIENLNQWAALKTQSLTESESITSYYSEVFETDEGDSVIAFFWTSVDNSIDFEVGVELVKKEESNGKWTFAHFHSSGADIKHSDYSSALSIAQSISYLADNVSPLDEYFTDVSSAASVSTNFPVSDEGFNWFSSPWFGVFYDSGKNWVYHYWLGWIYSQPSEINNSHWIWSERSGWLWTYQKSFPYLFCSDLSNWLYLDLSPNNGTRCYDYYRMEWKKWDDFFSIPPVDVNSLTPAERTAIKLEEIKNSDLTEKEKAKAAVKTIILGK